MAEPQVAEPTLPLAHAAAAPSVPEAQTPPVTPASADGKAAPAAQASQGAEKPVAQDGAAGTPPSAPERTPSLLETFAAEQAAKDAATATPPSAAEKPPAAPEKAVAAKPADEAAKPAVPAAPAAAAESAKSAEAAKAEPAAPLTAVEYKYTVPDTIKMDEPLKAEVHKVFDEFRANPAEGAQKLFDLHATQMKVYAEHLQAENRALFNKYREDMRKTVMGDEQIGGAGHQTAMGAIARMRDLAAPKGSLDPRKWPDGSPRPSEFDEFLETTGAGDHPLFLKMLHNFSRWFDEPAPPPPNARPPANNGRPPTTRMRQMYDHPRSPNGRA